jgi:Protein of unknown function (DUF3014)
VNDPDVRLLVLIVLVAGLAGAAWYFWDDIRPQLDGPVVMEPEAVVDEPPARKDPIHPLSPLGTSGSRNNDLVPLPPLDESDSYFQLALVDIFGTGLRNLLVSEALVDKFVATVDNLPRAYIAEKARPVGRLASTFRTDIVDDGEAMTISAANYDRYDTLVSLVMNANLDLVNDTYRRFYPLFQESYVRLGYPNAYFNDRVVAVIDHLLATPEPAGPIYVVQPNVLYEFADPDLEALSSGQKLLLRMGNDHAGEIKQTLRELRTRITE